MWIVEAPKLSTLFADVITDVKVCLATHEAFLAKVFFVLAKLTLNYYIPDGVHGVLVEVLQLTETYAVKDADFF